MTSTEQSTPGTTSTIHIPAAALHGLRAAVLGGPDGELRLRDAGYVAGLAIYDDFASAVQTSDGVEPMTLALDRFVDALAEYLTRNGWGATEIHATSDGDVLRLRAGDWVEGEPDAGAAYAACHFSTGMLAGFFGRAAQRPLAVLEVACRSAGADRCEFAVGSREVMDAMWEAIRGE